MACEVSLISHTTNAAATVAAAAKLCYSSSTVLDILDVLEHSDSGQVEQFITMLNRSGHLSPFEHASYSFAIDGLSRVASHQLVRHRIASFSQQSQRYVIMDTPDCVIPDSVSNNEDAKRIFQDQIKTAHTAYEEVVSLGIPKEDARFILPHGWKTRLVVTMNARELHHFFSIRLCHRAQWEIQQVAQKMLHLVYEASPALFTHVGPSCITKGQCTEVHSCKRPYKNFEEMMHE